MSANTKDVKGLEREIFGDLARSVLDMDEDLAVDAAERAVGAQLDAQKAITEGLSKGMDAAGQKYEEEEYFVPELLLCSDAMYAGVEILKPHIPQTGGGKGRAVVGVVSGDTHDIGKNLVKLFMEAAGFQVTDLGRDVPLEKFVDAVRDGAQFICMSTLMTTTMGGMERVIQLLKEAGLRDRVKVIVGGAPISQAFANKIGADAYSSSAPDAPATLMRLAAIPA